METRQQRLIREALEHGSGKDKAKADAEPEVSLRDQSLAHTDPNYVPKTLTPHEWEAYYAANGVPASHKRGTAEAPASREPAGVVE
ncbi:unnamed protein product, partial [Ectocarpus sp. 12 AP-2014]